MNTLSSGGIVTRSIRVGMLFILLDCKACEIDGTVGSVGLEGDFGGWMVDQFVFVSIFRIFRRYAIYDIRGQGEGFDRLTILLDR